jgi:hypothetical protein
MFLYDLVLVIIESITTNALPDVNLANCLAFYLTVSILSLLFQALVSSKISIILANRVWLDK